jgi:hypothetical protein
VGRAARRPGALRVPAQRIDHRRDRARYRSR